MVEWNWSTPEERRESTTQTSGYDPIDTYRAQVDGWIQITYSALDDIGDYLVGGRMNDVTIQYALENLATAAKDIPVLFDKIKREGENNATLNK